MVKETLYGAEAREKLKAGIDKLANAVKVTLGPKGRNVIIYKNMRFPYVTKDGVTVAKEVYLEDMNENAGALMVSEAAIKTAIQAGDGTTTATVLAQAFIHAGFDEVSKGKSPVEVKAKMDADIAEIVAALKGISKPCTDNETIEKVATIAANNDYALGKLIADTYSKIGIDGVVTISESATSETHASYVDGLRIDTGYLSPFFITNSAKMSSELQDCYVLIYEKAIGSMTELFPLMQKVASSGSPLLILADNVEGEAMASLVLTHQKGALKICCTKLPAFGDIRKEVLKDIAAITGATITGPERGHKLTDVGMSHLGKVAKVTVTKDSTLFVSYDTQKSAIEKRVTELQEQVTAETGDSETIKMRIAALKGGIAVIHVGGNTEIEMRERKDRVDDAIRATQSAIEEGVVAGGGFTLGNLSKNEPGIVYMNLLAPFMQILTNAGYSEEGIKAIASNAEGKGGFNAKTGEYGDMFDMGIIDATKVVRCALENAASVAGIVLTSECILSEKLV